MKRSRAKYLLAAVAVVFLGLASRRYSPHLPQIFASYAGDILWALTAFLCTAVLFPRWRTIQICIAAMLFAIGIEISQLYHTPWLDELRHTTAGAMILGQGFLWSDLICYAVGVAAGYFLDRPMRK